MNSIIPYKELIGMVSFFADIGKPYKYERSGQSVLLKVNGMTYYSTSIEDKKDRLPTNQIYFIAKVKKYIMKNKLNEKIPPNYKDKDLIKYLHYNRKIKRNIPFRDVYSVDIEKAYWVSALNQGFISKEIYNEGLDMDKKIRLSCLGTFAKYKFLYHFDGKQEVYDGRTDPQYPHIFFNQANAIYGVMDKCRKVTGDDFIFYWTDGIYVKGKKAADLCEKIIFEFGFKSKTLKLIDISRTDVGFIVREHGKEKIDEKMYKTNTK